MQRVAAYPHIVLPMYNVHVYIARAYAEGGGVEERGPGFTRDKAFYISRVMPR